MTSGATLVGGAAWSFLGNRDLQEDIKQHISYDWTNENITQKRFLSKCN